MAISKKAKQLAHYETEWWQGHHRKDLPMTLNGMSKLYELLFGFSNDDAIKCVKLRIEAGSAHDVAEDYEDKGDEINAKKFWKRTEELLEQHFQMVLDILTKTTKKSDV